MQFSVFRHYIPLAIQREDYILYLKNEIQFTQNFQRRIRKFTIHIPSTGVRANMLVEMNTSRINQNQKFEQIVKLKSN